MLLKHVVVKSFVLFGADFVAVHIDLDAARSIHQAGKRGLAHDAFGHEASCHADLKTLFRVGGKLRFNLLGQMAHGYFGGGKRIHAGRAQGL